MLQLVLFTFLCSQPPAGGDLQFTRFEYKNFDKGGLYTATVTLKRGETEVDLVSVVHIADKRYYEEIQHHLDTCDLVFYELVSDSTPEALSSFSALQMAAGELLKLSFQLQEINYQAPNLVHSDLSWNKITRLLGEHPVQIPEQDKILDRVLPQLNSQKEKALDFFADNPEARRSIKVFMGQLLGDIEGVLNMMNINRNDERKQEDILISARNKQAIKVITPHLERKGRFALFWGAAHMPDFAQRLMKRGFVPSAVHWHLAWRIGPLAKTRWF